MKFEAAANGMEVQNTMPRTKASHAVDIYQSNNTASRSEEQIPASQIASSEAVSRAIYRSVLQLLHSGGRIRD